MTKKLISHPKHSQPLNSHVRVENEQSSGSEPDLPSSPIPDNQITPSSVPSTTSPTKHRIPASHGYAAPLKAGTSFRLIDLKGQQVIDMSAFVMPFPSHSSDSSDSICSAEHLSPSYTLYHTRGQPIATGECIYTNMDRPLLKLTHDTVKTHDMTFMSCFPNLYLSHGFKPGEHRSCAENMLEAFGPYGMRYLTEVKDPFNVFQNTPNFSLKPLNTSKPGDWCQFEVLVDCVVGWSCCPFDIDGFNGGKVTDVMVVMGLRKDESRANEELMRHCVEV